MLYPASGAWRTVCPWQPTAAISWVCRLVCFSSKLLASQATNLTAVILADGDSGAVASDFSVNPYVLRRLASLSKGIDKKRLRRINEALFKADLQMKTTSVNPWLLIEAALVDIG